MKIIGYTSLSGRFCYSSILGSILSVTSEMKLSLTMYPKDKSGQAGRLDFCHQAKVLTQNRKDHLSSRESVLLTDLLKTLLLFYFRYPKYLFCVSVRFWAQNCCSCPVEQQCPWYRNCSRSSCFLCRFFIEAVRFSQRKVTLRFGFTYIFLYQQYFS